METCSIFSQYLSEFEVIDGLLQHPLGMNFETWLLYEHTRNQSAKNMNLITTSAMDFFISHKGIVSISGSRLNQVQIRRADDFFTDLNWIVLSPSHLYAGSTEEEMRKHDRLHLARIAFSHALVVLIGKEQELTTITTNEIIFAAKNAIPVFYFNQGGLYGISQYNSHKRFFGDVLSHVDAFLEGNRAR